MIAQPRRLSTAAACTVAALLLTLAPNGRADELGDSLQLGVDYMVSIQGTYPGTTRVNPGPPGTIVPSPGTPNVWEWEIGSGMAYSNTWGASALGLVAASGQLPDAPGGFAAAAYAFDLVADSQDAGVFDRSETYAYGTDLELLGRLGGGAVRSCTRPRIPPALRASNSLRKQFTAAGRAWLGNFPSGAAEADRIIDGRTAGPNGDLSGWDVSLVIRGALALGEVEFACEAAQRVLDRRPDWEGSSPPDLQDWWGGPSEAGLAYALSLLTATGECGDWSAEVRDLRDRLHDRQATDSDGGPVTGVDAYGSLLATYAGFDYPATQLTSYGVLGFLGCGRDATEEDRAAAARAMGFLVRGQYPEGTGAVLMNPAPDPRPADGGWPTYPTFWVDDSNGEVNGEALLALAYGARAGLSPAPLPPAPSALAPAGGSGPRLSLGGEREWSGTAGTLPSVRAPLVRPASPRVEDPGRRLREPGELEAPVSLRR